MRTLVLSAILLTTPAPASVAQPPDRFASARAVIRQLLDSAGVRSMAVAVAHRGRIVWQEGFGGVDEHTPFSLASISKPITATGLMLLVAEGKVDLDAPVNRYLGEGQVTGLAGSADGATVRRVLSHTAGLPLHYRFYYEDLPYGEPTMDDVIARYAIVTYPPGTDYQYSNLGYGIIDHVIARVSGVPYAEFMRRRVFAPLGLTRTSVHLPGDLASHAAGRFDAGGRAIPFYDFDHDGGSAVWASAHDLVRFGMFHLQERVPDQRRILPDSVIDLMQRVWGTPRANYGLGWALSPRFGFERVAHSGGMPGVTTHLALFPTERLAIVVLSNRTGTPVFRVTDEIAASLVPRYADSLRAEQARERDAPSSGDRVPFAPPPGMIGTWTGTVRTWRGTVPLELVVQPDGDVHVALDDQLRTLLNGPRLADSVLTGRFAGTMPTPDVALHAHSILLRLRWRGGTLLGQASAQTTAQPVYFAHTSYVELTRQ